MSSLINVHYNTSTNILVEPFNITIAHVHPELAAMRAAEMNTQPLPWHWPWDDESIFLIHTLIINIAMMSIVNAAVASLPHPSQEIQELWGCREAPDGSGGPHASSVTPIFNNISAARWVQAAM